MNLSKLTTTALLLIGFPFVAAGQNQEVKRHEFHPAFFAFQTGFANAKSKSPKYVAQLVDRAGFDGIELMGLSQVDQFMAELEPRGLRLFSLYLGVNLDDEQPYSPEIKKALTKWKNKIPYVWLYIQSRQFTASDSAGDKRCVEILREMSDWCQPLGVKIGIYHHVGMWSEKFSDAVRVAKKVDRKNVGAVFNLCHYLKTSGPKNLQNELASSLPVLTLVSINGADDGDTQSMGWDRLIRPLGEGAFDVGIVLQTLKAGKYKGPIGLQGFAIKKTPEEFFPNSVRAYQQMLEKIDAARGK